MKLIQNCEVTATLQISASLTSYKFFFFFTLQFFTGRVELSTTGYVMDLILLPRSSSKLRSVPTLAQSSRMGWSDEQEVGNPQLRISEVFQLMLHAFFRQKITSVLYTTANNRRKQKHLHQGFLKTLLQAHN